VLSDLIMSLVLFVVLVSDIHVRSHKFWEVCLSSYCVLERGVKMIVAFHYCHLKSPQRVRTAWKVLGTVRDGIGTKVVGALTAVLGLRRLHCCMISSGREFTSMNHKLVVGKRGGHR